MRTTIDINDAKLAEIREKARRENRPFRVVLDEVLGLGLAVSKSPKNKRVSLPLHPLGTKPGFQGMSLNQLYDQIEAESDAVIK